MKSIDFVRPIGKSGLAEEYTTITSSLLSDIRNAMTVPAELLSGGEERLKEEISRMHTSVMSR